MDIRPVDAANVDPVAKLVGGKVDVIHLHGELSNIDRKGKGRPHHRNIAGDVRSAGRQHAADHQIVCRCWYAIIHQRIDPRHGQAGDHIRTQTVGEKAQRERLRATKAVGCRPVIGRGVAERCRRLGGKAILELVGRRTGNLCMGGKGKAEQKQRSPAARTSQHVRSKAQGRQAGNPVL